MNTLDTIFSRRSVRSYLPGLLCRETLETIIRAGKAAPIGLRRYDTVFLSVVQNKELLEAIDKAACEAMGREPGGVLYGAPCFVVVSVKMSEMHSDNVGYSNAACVVENMSLAAAELGIGSCHIWGAVRILNTRPDLAGRLGLSEGFIPVCGIILGETEEKYSIHEPQEIETKYI